MRRPASALLPSQAGAGSSQAKAGGEASGEELSLVNAMWAEATVGKRTARTKPQREADVQVRAPAGVPALWNHTVFLGILNL